ncbi:5-methylcytosine rRNA methyltransferase NSUN4 isoform X2 [Prorops nasuta]
MKEETKYVAVINNLSEPERIEQELQLRGALNLKSVYNIYLQSNKNKEKKVADVEIKSEKLNQIISNVQMTKIESSLPEDYNVSLKTETSLKDDKEKSDDFETQINVQLRSLEEDLQDYEPDLERIVDLNDGNAALNEYVPATQLKGMEDWVLESDHYAFYDKGADFSVMSIEEQVLLFPERLKVYTFEEGSKERFPSPKKGAAGVSDYFLFDGGSILPVLALDVRPGDLVLDMCAAPGGKTLAILQTFNPALFVANDISMSRVNRINKVLNEFLGEIENSQLFVTCNDARSIEDIDLYNKILVDVPCTTDRHNLHTDENNLFKPSRLQERMKLPELQMEILTNALKIVAKGGTVVYSTCTLNPIQNDGVVQAALKNCWEQTSHEMVVKDLSVALSPLNCLFKFGNYGLKHGHLVIPTIRKNWGPMYFCKIMRVK